MTDKFKKPDYLFEVSWEICNKIGGIHTVLSTKALWMVNQMNDNYLCIGPDVWKETHGNPEFVEDKYLYRSWRKQATRDGLHFRIGRWNVPGSPIAILVDFTPLFSEKDDIFTDLWIKFGLNSLSGQWDYTEPAMFGYAAGKVIESFYNYHLSSRDSILAHFHEWMTGSGVLYIKDKVPQVGTIFTTHATSLGRSIAGNGQQLYADMGNIDPESRASELGVVSKHSMEKTAATNADAFTTVSKIAAKECHKLLEKEVDIIAPNGFNNSFVPEEKEFGQRRKNSREQLLRVARGLMNQDIPSNSLLVINSGRYEFKNKGIDVFIESLGQLNKKKLKTPIVAFIMIPGHQTGVRPEVVERIAKPDFKNPLSGEYITHKLVEADSDPVLKSLKSAGLKNSPEDNVKVVFLPAYLNGSDGALNLDYYDALIGMDYSIFPSYYEPWGYTPLESLAFRIPTLTTSLAGFGIWARDNFPDDNRTVAVLERNDSNAQEISDNITGVILSLINDEGYGDLTDENVEPDSLVHKNMIPLRSRAQEIASAALWDQLVENYHRSYELAMQKVTQRADTFKVKKQPVKPQEIYKAKVSKPKWKKVLIEISVPKELEDLQKLAKNLWWTWNYEATQLFERIDPDLWEKSEKSPPRLLDNLTVEHYQNLIADKEFMEEYARVVKMFDDYMKKGEKKSSEQIAYFSMEYGLHTSVKTYSGGLGVLAGDFLKQASDDNIDMIGIGLLYRYGYFSQNLSLSGEQLASYKAHNFTYMSAQPVRNEMGEWVKISIAFPGRNIYAKVWKIDIGRIPLYLLDTDIPENASIDKVVTHQLYGGDWENRFKQEFMLGIGGIRMLDALGIKPRVYHLNEGHAAFAGLERLRKFVQDDKLSFEEAMEAVRSSSLFTTHTPVPAGHDFFSEDMLRTYMPHYADRLGVSWETFMSLGKIHPENPDERYSMSVLATKLASEVNGVSKIHGGVSREMFKDLYPGYFNDEIHIGHVTNGVHYGTWCAPEWQKLYAESFGNGFLNDVSDPAYWEKIYDLPDDKIWEMREVQRKKLTEYIKKRLLSNLSRRQETPKKVYQTLEGLNDKALTIGFARRFATYKRAQLLFNDLERLSQIVNNPDMPVQFLYAGKAHPADKAGQDLIKHIVEVSKKKEFRGKIIFLEDYDMELGEALVKGVDIWLNTPTRPLEASGTSGQKASINGVMNFSVLDGWWAEGYTPEAGWAIKEEKTYENQAYQDELDAEVIYNTFENEITPMFYERNKDGVPVEWVRWVKNNIARIAPDYTNKRMMDDYFKLFYNKLFKRADVMLANNCEHSKELAAWKARMVRGWESIELVSLDLMNTSDNSLLLGDKFVAEIVLDLNELNESDFGVEVVFIQKDFEGEESIISVYEMEQMKKENEKVTFRCEVTTKRVGIYNYAFRMFPKHELLAHRQDLKLIRWF
ncbi:MAG: alpha-glucan family phosphorylase [Bacteroidetes bacterium]|nr:MAG: alpha-glucan family phosphorylase [Bacteroidota bacterium]